MLKANLNHQRGYTFIELVLVVAIIGLISSILIPKYDLILQKAWQSKTKNNLGNVRTAIALYFTDTNGAYPLMTYPQGLNYHSNGQSLTGTLVPKYLPMVPTPKLLDRMGSYNGLSGEFDNIVQGLMSLNPPKDVYIIWGLASYTPLLSAPYAYDNKQGIIYIPNGNYDTTLNNYFYQW